ncbi:TPA: hypothetical protein ACH3X3_003306 [Trebouxia sp. C0006]
MQIAEIAQKRAVLAQQRAMLAQEQAQANTVNLRAENHRQAAEAKAMATSASAKNLSDVHWNPSSAATNTYRHSRSSSAGHLTICQNECCTALVLGEYGKRISTGVFDSSQSL